MSRKFKCILFDLDGTLLSTGGAGIRALDRACFELFGLKNSMAGIQPAGKTDPAIIREIFTSKLERNCTPKEMSEVQERYLHFLDDECEKAADYNIIPGIPGLLTKLKALEILMGLGTGNLEAGARKKLKRSGLNPFFKFGGFGSDSEDRVEILLAGHRRACSESGTDIPAKDTYIVGDTVRDISAARYAGFPVVAVATGSSPAHVLKEHSPDHLLTDFENPEEFIQIVLNGK